MTAAVYAAVTTTLPATPVMATPGVKLPILTIKKFNGDFTRWVPLWDVYESAIHNNPSC